MSNRRNRERRPARRAPFRDPMPVILIVCEGERTEKEYFEGFRRACRNPRVDIKIAREHGVPRTLVAIAREYKNENPDRYDAVWCVFDIDDHPHLDDARQMARDNSIEVAVSNPCFELWLLLHFRDNPGMKPRETIRKMLSRHVAGYDKGIEFARYEKGYPMATRRAEMMDRLAEGSGSPGCNPTTGVYRLTREIERKD